MRAHLGTKVAHLAGGDQGIRFSESLAGVRPEEGANTSPHNKGGLGGIGKREMRIDKDLRAGEKVCRFLQGKILSKIATRWGA